MAYTVIAQDGSEYGPVEFDVLKTWAQEGRVHRNMNVRETETGAVVLASAIPDLFPQPAPGPAPSAPMHSPYPPAPVSKHAVDDGKGALVGSLVRSGLAVLMFFALKGLGLVFGIYALVYAIQCQAKGNKYGVIAIVVAVLALAAVGIGWIVRMQGGGV